MSNDESVDQPVGPSAGSQLKSAREAKGLEIADIANAQHLRPSVIQAIENGDYQQIDSELFLRGYVRAYAGQVGLNADSLIAQLNTELEPMRKEQELARESSPLVTIEQRKLRKKRIARTVMILLFLAVVAFIAYKVFFERLGRLPEPEAAEEVIVPEPAEDARVPEATQEGVSEPTSVDAGPGEEEDLVTEEEQGALAPETPAPVVEQPSPVASVEEAADEVISEPRAAESEPVREEVVSQPLAPTEASGEVSMQASFIADCWVLVTDANGERLVSSLRRAGDRIDVSGQPPLQVVIGAADAVSSVSFQGEVVDLKSYRVVNNRVEFTLDN